MNPDAVDRTLAVVFFGGLAIYPILQIWALRVMSGRFKLAASIPIVPAIAVIGVSVIGTIMGAELWHFLVIVTVPALALYLLALHAAFRIRRRRSERDPAV